MNLDHFGMDTITLAGPLEAKLRAVRAAGFTQIMLSAQDIVGHPGGEAAAIAAVHKSGLRVTGFQVLRDFEGLDGHLHPYKVDVAKAMLEMCRAPFARLPRRRGAQRKGDRARAPARRDGLPRGLQLRGIQRRLPAVAAAGGRGAGATLGEMDHRPRRAPQPAGTPAGLALLTWWSSRRRRASCRPGRSCARS